MKSQTRIVIAFLLGGVLGFVLGAAAIIVLQIILVAVTSYTG